MVPYSFPGMRVGFINSLGEGSFFPAGGAGIILSRAMVASLVSTCKCWDSQYMVRRWVRRYAGLE